MPGQHILPWIGILICLYLLYSTSLFDKVVGTLIILAGIPIYVFFSPKQDIIAPEEDVPLRRGDLFQGT